MKKKTDNFSIIPIDKLYNLIDKDYSERKEIFGIPEELFFKASKFDRFRMQRYGKTLETPIGVAAGPHTQMAQNIISAWLCGARYIELKTVQTLDEIHVSKPCIDIQDEGYNCEWSQELKIQEAFDEYLKAWIIIHLLNHKFGNNKSAEQGMIFNMSVGYNMEGLLKDNVQWFFKKMNNCKTEKENYVELLEQYYPDITSIAIPDKISDNITLSTMHGCPPEEIEKIGLYLINVMKLHTTIKLNPTLLGAEKLRNILNVKLGFKTEVPDIAFEHDLKYPDAIKLINSLTDASVKNNVHFGLKLTNTLESVNNRTIFTPDEKMMYMSGRALHPISINLAKKLQNEYDGALDISFCAGADCFNVPKIFECGLKPITASSDILKPGGYARLTQYLEELKSVSDKADKTEKLNSYADKVLTETAYKCDPFAYPNIKSNRELGHFDCIKPPCVDTCPTNQDIPDYLYYSSKGEFDKAFSVIMKKNPFPSVLGMVCDHLCQTKCTRINYDSSLLIREVKRFIAEQGYKFDALNPAKDNGHKISIIGAGPSGLACAYFLKLAGFAVNVYETKDIAGGMVSDAIPSFRLKAEAINTDIERIKNLGVNIFYNSKIDTSAFENIRKESDFIYLATGAAKFKTLGLENEDSKGIMDAFKFLSSVKKEEAIELGKNVIIIGGGNTAMDVARTAYRLAPKDSKVVVLYRRTRNEMPADVEEVKALIEEGIEIIELAAPEKIILKNGKVCALLCSKMKLGEADASGRAKPVKIEGSEFEIKADTIIPALGQDVDIDFIEPELLKNNPKTFETAIPGIYIGGDAMRGAATVIKAVGDGRKVAAQIINKSGIEFSFDPDKANRNLDYKDYIIAKSKRVKGENISETDTNNRKNFNLVSKSLTREQVIKEASRCLLCDDVCSICTTVCPNRANYTYFAKPLNINITKAIKNTNTVSFEKSGVFNISQKFQILNIGDFCNECGNCTTFCPTNGAPYRDKPKFYLTSKSFNEVENGFMLSKLENKIVLIHKQNNQISTLTLQDNQFVYENENVKGYFDINDFALTNAEFTNKNVKEYIFNEAAEMFVLFEAGKNLY
ncbi:MAG: putative selenate reductase subunit YgfK [Bacteroidetes bacterium]|nr:putative selenate reductase subunit YgfK [Bacteroidota bacterium]